MPARSTGNSSPSPSASAIRSSAASSIGSTSVETIIAASPIIFTSRTGAFGDLARHLLEATGNRAQLLGRDLLAEAGELDQIGEADREVGRTADLA